MCPAEEKRIRIQRGKKLRVGQQFAVKWGREGKEGMYVIRGLIFIVRKICGWSRRCNLLQLDRRVQVQTRPEKPSRFNFRLPNLEWASCYWYLSFSTFSHLFSPRPSFFFVVRLYLFSASPLDDVSSIYREDHCLAVQHCVCAASNLC